MDMIKLKNAKSWKPGGGRPIAICAFGFFVAFGLRQFLTPFLDESLAMVFFTINCIVMSYLFGYIYSFALLCISIPTALFFFRKPFYMIEALNRKDIYLIVVYTTIITVVTIIIEWLQRERYAAVLQQRVSETRYKLLIESDQARRAEYAEQFANPHTEDASP